jgi:hypothetical protein
MLEGLADQPPSFTGAAGGIRTPDPQVRSLMLYPTELRPRGTVIVTESDPVEGLTARSQGVAGHRHRSVCPRPAVRRSNFVT